MAPLWLNLGWMAVFLGAAIYEYLRSKRVRGRRERNEYERRYR